MGTTLRHTLFDYGHRVSFSEDFQAVDHRASAWGLPHPGQNVAAVAGNPYNPQFVSFGYFTSENADYDHMRMIGAYFSTNTSIMVRITAYHIGHLQSAPLGSVVVGGAGETWNNRYVEIGWFGSSIEALRFEGVNSPDDLLGFCIDDMTIVPVPEPSSLVAVGLGLLPLGAALARRRRR